MFVFEPPLYMDDPLRAIQLKFFNLKLQIEGKTKELRHKVELLTSEVEVLRQEKRTGDAINQSVILQRDMLKSMLESNTKSAANESMEVVSEAPQVITVKIRKPDVSGFRMVDLDLVFEWSILA